MPVPITCDQCQRSYNVDDKLAGKTVKCKNCGHFIRVSGPQTDAPVEDSCLSCGAPMPARATVCKLCGYSRQSAPREASFLEAVIQDKTIAKRKNARWVRKPGNPLLESLDPLLKLLVILTLLAGIIMTVVRILRSPVEFSFATLLPMFVVIGLLALVMAPLVTLAISITVRALKLAPRDDIYTRVVACCLLPFAVSLLTGWPDIVANWNLVQALSWPLAIGLLIYFFRADLIEWSASVAAAGLAILISLLFLGLANQLITSASGPLYADMLPLGPWQSLATGHSPDPPPPVKAPVARIPVAATGEFAIPETPAANATQNSIAQNPNSQPPALTRPTPPTPMVLASDFADFFPVPREFQGVGSLIIPPAGGDTFLTVKNVDNATEVQRWSLTPPTSPDSQPSLAKKERLADSPLYYAKKPAVFALSPKGDAIVALSFFPTRKIEIVPLDTRFPRKSIPMDGVGPPDTVGTLPGFLDSNRFTVRWDFNGKTVLQVFTCPGGVEVRPPLTFDASIPDPHAVIISPNGKILAAFGSIAGSSRNQIVLLNMDNGQLLRRINVSELPVRHLGMAFSPDNSQIALYAAIADLPTVIAFKISNGDIAMQNLLSQTPLDKDTPVAPHALIYLPTAQALLLNGNDLLDTATGKKFASFFDLPGAPNPQYLGASTIAFILENPDQSPRLVLAKLNDAKLFPRPR